jgi:hypothetical protein
MEPTHLKKQSMKDLVGSEENGYPIPDPNKTIVNITNEPSDAHTHTHKIP